MYCVSCGREFQEDANFCPYCGMPVMRNNQNYNNAQNYCQPPYGNGQYYGYPSAQGYNAQDPQDVPSAVYNAIAFFFPIVGFILYVVWRDSLPKKAKAIGKWALISVVIAVVIYILIAIAMFAASALFAFTDVPMDLFIM